MHEYTGPHDYFNEGYVREWAGVANSRRPFRTEFFDAFAAEVAGVAEPRVLDLGGGPGFLAERILNRCAVSSYHLFDFSPHMLDLSRARLACFGETVRVHQGSFLDTEWWRLLEAPFDVVVSMQAIHEVRDAARIPRLYNELRLLLREGGMVLLADQVNNEQKTEEHFLTVSEHETALRDCGFREFRQVHAAGDLVMFAARR